MEPPVTEAEFSPLGGKGSEFHAVLSQEPARDDVGFVVADRGKQLVKFPRSSRTSVTAFDEAPIQIKDDAEGLAEGAAADEPNGAAVTLAEGEVAATPTMVEVEQAQPSRAPPPLRLPLLQSVSRCQLTPLTLVVPPWLKIGFLTPADYYQWMT